MIEILVALSPIALGVFGTGWDDGTSDHGGGRCRRAPSRSPIRTFSVLTSCRRVPALGLSPGARRHDRNVLGTA